VLASAGHPAPLWRRADGRVQELSVHNGRLLGCADDNLGLQDGRFHLDPGETLIFYTDGFTEARAIDRETMFGTQRLCELFASLPPQLSLPDCAERARTAAEHFRGHAEL